MLEGGEFGGVFCGGPEALGVGTAVSCVSEEEWGYYMMVVGV